jgi:CheY-like chemotaxis protein
LNVKILVVDDNDINRKLLRKFLERWDYTVIECDSGEAAIDQFTALAPDLILMDIMMPGIDGRQATREIKQLSGKNHIPVIYVTALREEQALAEALEAGGDDYVTKPVDKDVLYSKIRAHHRILELTHELGIKNEQLVKHNRRLRREHDLVNHFFERQQACSDVDPAFLDYHISSASAFNGDVLLVKRCPGGGLNLLLGDFTGHGLTAAMGSLPVSEIFLRMTEQGQALVDIVRQINATLHELLPSELFLAATVAHLDRSARKLFIWSGGLPKAYLVAADNGRIREIGSQHLPLGVLADRSFDAAIATVEVDCGDRLYLYTDGVVEAVDERGNSYGENRLVELLRPGDPDVIARVRESLDAFIGGQAQRDDISMVQVTMTPVKSETPSEDQREAARVPFPFRLEVQIGAEAMRSQASLNAVADMLTANDVLRQHKSVLYTIISELYTNALEHGILGLDSSLKLDDESYINYYSRKKEALDSLAQGEVSISCALVDEGRQVVIQVRHDGNGGEKREFKPAHDRLHGWGMNIVEHLCDHVEYKDAGRCVEVTYNTASAPLNG